MDFKKICVLGLGYIGLPTASMFASKGVKVTGVDINLQVVNSLQNGELHIYEPGLRELVQSAVEAKNLDISDRPRPADAFIIAVPTPFYDDKLADMRFVVSAAESIVPHLRKGGLVVLESTSPPRTTIEIVAPILEKSGLKAGQDFFLAYSPERVLPGQILHELVENARVVGGVTPASSQAAHDLYSIIVRGQIVMTDATTAEMVKLMENTYRDVNIAIANEFSRLADRFGINAWEAISIANLHPRVKILNPGPGVGGHCISVDPWFLVEAAPDLATLIRTARQVNDGQPHFVVQLVEKALGGSLQDRRIAALGLAYKPDIDDLRESPAVEVVHLLKSAGAVVNIFEPFKPDFIIEGTNSHTSLEAALNGADILLLLVGHSQFRTLTPEWAAARMPGRIAVDCTDAWRTAGWQRAGYHLFKLGVGIKPEG